MTCPKLDDKGVVISTPFIWKTSLHQKEPESNSYIKYPIIYNDNIVVPTTNGKNNWFISMINTKNGEIMWHWNDVFEYEPGYKGYIDIYAHYQYKNLLIYQCGSRSYCIDLDNGTTKWRHRRDRSFVENGINPFGQYSYFIYGPDEIDENGYMLENYTFIAYIGNIETGDISEFLTANFTYECNECVRGVYHIVQVPDKKNLLLVAFMENLKDWVIQPFFGLYDHETKEWLWDRILLSPPERSNVIDWPPIINNNKIYAVSGNGIVCHNLETGLQIWKREFGGNFLFTGFIVEEGKVIANCENAYAYALDAETGNTSWSVPTAGTCSRLSYLNGIVYFVGGSGGGRFFAIEVSSGKLLWKIDAALLGDGYGALFKTNAVYVLPAKNNEPAKVIALSHKNAYCFEAIR